MGKEIKIYLDFNKFGFFLRKHWVWLLFWGIVLGLWILNYLGGRFWGIDYELIKSYTRGYFYEGGFEKVAVAADSSYGSLAGFSKQRAAKDLHGARAFGFGENGEVYVADTEKNRILALWDEDRDGVLENREIFLEGIDSPGGIVYYQGLVLASAKGKLWLMQDTNQDHRADISEELILDLPYGKYQTNHLSVNHQGIFYIAQGPTADEPISDADSYEGTILSYDLDSRKLRVLAKGFSNPLGIAVHPQNGDIFMSDSTRLSPGGRPEELNLVEKGHEYGWPECFGYDPERNCPQKVNALLEIIQGVGAAGMEFIKGDLFPPTYKNNLFIALEGGKSGDPKKGRSVLRVRLTPASGTYQLKASLFAKGFDRPVDIKEDLDGSLVILDSGSGELIRIAPIYSAQPTEL